MLAADLGQRVVGDARQLRRLLRRRHQLERRIGEADHLAQVAELVEQAQPRIDIDQRLQAAESRCTAIWSGASFARRSR